MRCAMVVSKDLADNLSLLDKVGSRQYMVQSLIKSYRLTEKFTLLPLVKATMDDLLVFHSCDYVKFLASPTDSEEEEYGLGYDCPVHPALLDWCLTIAGGSLTAANCLLSGQARVVINWGGGWHHAQRGAAAGFCYVNDVVLAVHKLQARFKRILYIDLDVHHGDGVENAFSATDKVVTFSIHKYEPGYFPGTGDITDTGTGRGKHHSVNIPLKEGVTDQMYRRVFSSLFPSIMSSFMPDCIVLQCGADCLTGDSMGGFNLTPDSIADCVDDVLGQEVSLLLLGGGGYNLPNTSKCWTSLTARVVGKELDVDIPDWDPFFTEYGPDFQLEISKGCVRNRNTEEEVDRLIKMAMENILMMKSSKM